MTRFCVFVVVMASMSGLMVPALETMATRGLLLLSERMGIVSFAGLSGGGVVSEDGGGGRGRGY